MASRFHRVIEARGLHLACLAVDYFVDLIISAQNLQE